MQSFTCKHRFQSVIDHTPLLEASAREVVVKRNRIRDRESKAENVPFQDLDI